jgi:signal transduction histidine kinase
MGAESAPKTTRVWLSRLGGWIVPAILIGVVLLSLRGPVAIWLRGTEIFDEEAIREWVREARIESANLPELARRYLELVERETQLNRIAEEATGDDRVNLLNSLRELESRLDVKREEIGEFLKSLGSPPTGMYRGQLPLFPLIYRLSVHFDPRHHLTPINWDSQLPREAKQYRELKDEPLATGAAITVQYHLHAYHQVQAQERQDATRRLLLGGVGLLAGLAGTAWLIVFQRRQRQREHKRLLAEQQAGLAERGRLEEELRRQEAERRHEEAERQNLELKSQLFANIGIMAGSYAHNIKNLLVRPNDLLRRCLDEHPTGADQNHMLREVKDTLGTVTERLQQILQTIRRDPTKTETTRIDLASMVGDMHRTWNELARDKWKMSIVLEQERDPATRKPVPVWIDGDLSHLQQAIENLVFNARDATFEMRNRLREEARAENVSEADKRQALLAAAAWKGHVTLRVFRDGANVVLEVADNGIGMTDEVRQNCLKTHFSTKRNNALFAGLSAGMGLGLSFVSVILAHHKASLDVESKPHQGATFRVRFPAATPLSPGTPGERGGGEGAL